MTLKDLELEMSLSGNAVLSSTLMMSCPFSLSVTIPRQTPLTYLHSRISPFFITLPPLV